MIPEVSTAIQVRAKRCFDSGPGENSGLGDGALIDRVEQKRAQTGAQPVMRGDVETFLGTPENRAGKAVLHEIAKDELERSAADF